ncbi:Tubulin beta chain (Beta tubulin) [Mucor velutinosus]|uniref:Tubulin beta chain (Beta tubulin) n=1 Tax=Mucor velutinosus TaxID=708070 RepID=A0AAN7DQF4_9FUNG|nr:Tubulin beta chain (Beta tubulin) [Mucor velutinosus]
MLPNSRIIPPNNNLNNTNKNVRARSNSAVNDSSVKKGFMSRLLTSPTGSSSSPKEYNTNSVNSRPKYESVLGIQTKDDYAAWGTPRITPSDQKAAKPSSGFGKLFKKKAKTNDENENLFEDDQPKVRPIHGNSSRKHTKIPLAPPPNYPRTRAISQPNQQQFLTNLPDQYLAKRPQTPSLTTVTDKRQQPFASTPPAMTHAAAVEETIAADCKAPEISLMNKRSSSALSNRKSSGSYSIYSTFGGNESEYSIEEPKARSVTPPVPVPAIATNTNDSKRRETARHSSTAESDNSFTTVHEQHQGAEQEPEDEEEDNQSETITEDSSETTDDEFVDATGFSQEDMEREKRMTLEKNLSKRLSGGHFGSAGGLVLSINHSSDEFGSAGSTPLPLPTATKRKSQKIPEDDELAQSLLNWKRHSDSSKRWSMRNSSSTTATATTTTVMEDTGDKHSSTITVIDMRSTSNNTLPHGSTEETTTSKKAAAEKEEEEEELSVPDKLALRKEAEEALTGANTPPATKTTFVKVIDSSSIPKAPIAPTTSLPLPPVPKQNTLLRTLSAAETRSEPHYSSSEFSKTLDDVWKTSDDTLHLFDDDRTRQLQTSIQIRIADHDADPSIAENPPKEEEAAVDDHIKETAKSLWNEDETVVVKERMAEWLGQGKPFENAVLHQYMQFFVFTEMRLDSAFRNLCSKLYFKAEAQQIDRILESFANRYWDCNPECLFGSADVVYAVVYSLLLLNTDLHVAQGNHARMTRSEFIRNTMSTVRDQRDHEELMGHKKRSALSRRNWESELEYYLKEMYTSVKNYQILQPLSRKSSLSKRGSILGNRRVIGLKRSVNSIIRKSGRESMLVLDGYDQVPSGSMSPPPSVPPRSSISSGYTRPLTPSSMKSPRRESFSSTNSSAASFSSRCGSPTMIPQQQQQHAQQPMMQYLNSHASSLFSSRPPYYKEGVVMRKHLLENANHKARHREWRECYLEIQDGELRMYALQPSQSQLGDKNLFRHSSAAHFNLADINNNNRLSSRPSSPASFGGVLPSNSSSNSNNKWGMHSQLVGKIALNHTLSNPLPPPGYNRQRPHVFAIQQSDGGVYLFQVSNAEQAHEWVSTCNYWAARESKEPLPGGVGNMEYGWGACLSDVIMDLDAARKGYDQKVNYFSTQDPDSIMINDWMPPTATMVSSQLNEKEQYEVLQKHLVDLNEEINQHRDIKSKIMIKFPTKCNNYPKVISNWEARSKYLLHDIIKYQNYCDSLEKSIQLQQDFIEDDLDIDEDKVSTAGSFSSMSTKNKLEYQTHTMDLFDEINQELSLNL